MIETEGRKTDYVTATFGRDKGKVYLLTEWDSVAADKWANKMVLHTLRGSRPLSVPMESLFGRGMEAIFVIGLQGLLSASPDVPVILELLDELLECVQIVRDPSKRDASGKFVASKIVSPEDIAEVKTRWWLRAEVFRLHTDFSAADAVSKFLHLVMTTPQQDSGDTQT